MRRAFLGLAMLLAACGSDAHGGTTSDTPAGEKPCADGFAPLDADRGCAPVLPAEDCAPGTKAALGSSACVPVGVTSCGAGFAKDPSGWGCDAILPPTPCAGATRDRLGTTTCEPIGDCAFPPPGATHFVGPSVTEDATHFRTIAAAVAAAPSGAVIAIDTGTYTGEAITLPRSNVAIVGRCAAQVTIQQSPGVNGSAIQVGTNTGIAIKKVAFRGYNAAISVLGGKAHVDEVLIEDGTTGGIMAANAGTDVRVTRVVVRAIKPLTDQAFGVFASHGAKLTVEDSAIASNEFGNVAAAKSGTSLTILRSVIRDARQLPGLNAYGMGVYVGAGAGATIEDSAIVDQYADGVNVFTRKGMPGSLTIRRSVVRRTKISPATTFARGVEATQSKVAIDETTIGDSAQVEVLIGDASSAELTNVTLLGSAARDAKDRGALGLVSESAATHARSTAIVRSRAGAEIQGTGRLTLEGSLVLSPRETETLYENDHWIGVGLFVESKATLDLLGSTVEDARGIGILAVGTVRMSDSVVRRTRSTLANEFGRGISIHNGSTAEITRSAFVGNAEAGVLGMMGDASITLTQSTVSDTELDRSGRYGIGVLLGNAMGLVEKTTISGSHGIGLAVAAGGATVRGTWISNNAVGVHVQDGVALREGEGELDSRALLISSDTRFVGNATRLGGNVFVLPPTLEAIQKK